MEAALGLSMVSVSLRSVLPTFGSPRVDPYKRGSQKSKSQKSRKNDDPFDLFSFFLKSGCAIIAYRISKNVSRKNMRSSACSERTKRGKQEPFLHSSKRQRTIRDDNDHKGQVSSVASSRTFPPKRTTLFCVRSN